MEILPSILIPAFTRSRQEIPFFEVDLKAIENGDSVSLYGTESSLLDSLGLVSFLFILEEVIEQETGRKIKFSAEDIMSPAINPFSSIKEMVSWLAKMLNESSIA